MSERSGPVHVVDDDAGVRNAIRWLLEGEGLPVKTYASAEDFLARLDRGAGGCAVLDLRMPGMSGLELQETLLRRRIPLPLVFVTAHGDIALAVAAMRRGAVDFVEKPFADGHLLAAVRRALGQRASLPGEAHEAGIVRARAFTLSARERGILAAVIAGQSSKMIAADLGIALKTVEAHRARLMAKLGVSSLATLVRIAVLYGLLESPPG